MSTKAVDWRVTDVRFNPTAFKSLTLLPKKIILPVQKTRDVNHERILRRGASFVQGL